MLLIGLMTLNALKVFFLKIGHLGFQYNKQENVILLSPMLAIFPAKVWVSLT